MNNKAYIIYSSVIQLIILNPFFFFLVLAIESRASCIVGQGSAEAVISDFLCMGEGRTGYTGCLN